MNPRLRFVIAPLLVVLFVQGVCPAASKTLTDDEIFDRARRDLAGDPLVKGGALMVEVNGGVVTLKGVVETQKAKARAEKLVRKIRGVKSVVNQLAVKR
jgi:osmotically-inducible protein OsmY